MAILSNKEIEAYIQDGIISVTPYDIDNVQGATLDLRLGNKFLIPSYYNDSGQSVIRLGEDFPHEEKTYR